MSCRQRRRPTWTNWERFCPKTARATAIPGYQAKAEPPLYWNLVSAIYAYIYDEAAKMGVDVGGESKLVGYPTQFPSVTMINYNAYEPNARFWTLKLLKDNFGRATEWLRRTLAITICLYRRL